MQRSRWGEPKPPRDGVDGKNADEESIRRAVEAILADMPKPKNGRDADPAQIRFEVARAVSAIKAVDGTNGKDGERGPRGFEGPIGPMPRHEWKDTSLRFEQSPGVWGKWVDLRGPKGDTGFGGIIQTGSDAPPFDLDSLGLADPLVTPQEIIVKQNGIWLRMGWDDFVLLVGAPPPTGQRYADDYADHYTVYE